MDYGPVFSSISLLSPPRTNDGSARGSQYYLTSRFLPASPPKLAHKTSTCAAVGSTSTPLPPPHIKRHRVPASLRMTLTLLDSETDQRRQGCGSGYETPVDISATPATPSSITSSYSSAEGSSSSCASSAWNTPESISRTQQKLLLQRASSQDDMDEDETTHRAKTHREMERIQRDYRCTRMFADPILESLARCQARQDVWELQYQDQDQDQDQDPYYQLPRRLEEDSLESDCIL
ncbi:MAG: hypothetical protein J3Q66DRAFT_438667 [Benniella sp.]|nr:MAG: hypothetical protein J3Q66DRAFT_438667 [Benniella sp.]